MKHKSLALILCLFFTINLSCIALANPTGTQASNNESTSNEATITVAEILGRMKQILQDFQDFSASVEIVQYQKGRAVKTAGQLKVSQKEGLARMDFSEPSALRGQIVIADQKTMEVKMYLPVTDQIMVSSVENVAKEAGLALDFTNLSSLFNFDDLNVQLEEIHSDLIQGKLVNTYSLHASGYQNQIQKVKLNDLTWIPSEVFIYEDQELLGQMTFKNMVFDQNLERGELEKLPKVKVIRY